MKQNKKGFTLIELLIVVVIIGILAAVAIPKFSSTKEKAYLATMKTDLRNFATSMEGAAAETGGKYTAIDTSKYSTSPGVTITPTATSDGTGWSATATLDKLPGKTCGIYFNAAQPSGMTPSTTKEGEAACW